MEKNSKIKDFINLLFYVLEAFSQAFILIIIMLSLFFMRFSIIGHSMLPTLNDKDQVFLYHLFYTPKRGDIVIIKNPGILDYNIVKRVIAIEGDSLKIDSDLGKVYVNDKVLDEPYIYEPNQPFNHKNNEWDIPLKIPYEHIFVMGDNRNNSDDSRSEEIKLINKRDVMGKVIFLYFPINKFRFF